jgi:hypothetical protein
MKKTILAAGLVAFALASCSKDDDSVDKSKLLKKWYYVSYIYAGQTIAYPGHEACGKDYTEFMAGGVTQDVDVNGCDPYAADIYEGTWALNGNKLTIDQSGELMTATVTKLTDTALQIKVREDIDDDGVLDTYSIVFSSAE